MELYPGQKICKARSGLCVLYSGAIGSYELGMTVAHAFDMGADIEIQFESDMVGVQERIVGKCLATFDKLRRQDNTELTADLALLALDTNRCSVGNTVWFTCRSENTAFQLKIYKQDEIPDYTSVIILDQNGDFQTGIIHPKYRRFNDDNLDDYDDGLHDVIGICASEEQEAAVTQSGDSGALVMSFPNKENDFVYVYGIAIGICRKPTGESFTIANSLWKVLQEISTRKNHFRVDGMQNVDFA